jgi:hypothetical protein
MSPQVKKEASSKVDKRGMLESTTVKKKNEGFQREQRGRGEASTTQPDTCSPQPPATIRKTGHNLAKELPVDPQPNLKKSTRINPSNPGEAAYLGRVGQQRQQR